MFISRRRTLLLRIQRRSPAISCLHLPRKRAVHFREWTWGQRKRMADGKVSIAYGRFLGYDKGPEKYTMVVNEEQAIIVRRIFYMFLQGYTPHTISGLLTADSVPTPGGCKTWNQQTVRRMLSNEKYKGDALLQKEFTVDYLQKKIKKNEGELPQYYVKEDHEPIISPWLFDYVQERMKTRGGITYRHSGVTVLSSKVICGCCGSTYGPRPWHSTSYNNPVWQCHERVKKNGACDHRTNIYDKLLHYCIHDVARNLSVERGVIKTVRRILLAINATRSTTETRTQNAGTDVPGSASVTGTCMHTRFVRSAWRKADLLRRSRCITSSR